MSNSEKLMLRIAANYPVCYVIFSVVLYFI
jgi:hypothetical protein